MSWSSGSAIAADLWDGIEDLGVLANANPAKVKALARKFVEMFEAEDCDTLEEIDGPIGWEALAMKLEGQGAADKPLVGERFTDRWGGIYEFDGTRWAYVAEVTDEP